MSEIRQEIAYIREKARQFRVLARTYETGISEKVLQIAADMEEHADKLEGRTARTPLPQL